MLIAVHVQIAHEFLSRPSSSQRLPSVTDVDYSATIQGVSMSDARLRGAEMGSRGKGVGGCDEEGRASG